jgi:hypothetical protein
MVHRRHRENDRRMEMGNAVDKPCATRTRKVRSARPLGSLKRAQLCRHVGVAGAFARRPIRSPAK